MGWSMREFLGRRGNEFYVEIARDWITDRFNLTGLEENVDPETWAKYEEHYYRGMRMLAGLRDVEYTKEQIESGEFFYGLLHARYVLTNAGIEKLGKRFEKGLYGHCPKVTCGRQKCLPVGQSVTPFQSSVRLYCPRCRDLLVTEDSELDGAFFGPNLPHMFFMVKPEHRPSARCFFLPAECLAMSENHELLYKRKRLSAAEAKS